MSVKISGLEAGGSPDQYTPFKNIGGGMPSPGEVPAYTKTVPLYCNAAADVITDDPDSGTGIVAAELFTVTLPSNCIGVELSFNKMPVTGVDANGDFTTPIAFAAIVAYASPNDSVAITRINSMIADNGPGDYTEGDSAADTDAVGLEDVVGRNWAAGDVTRLDIGFRPTTGPAGFGKSPVILNIRMRLAV